MISQLLANITQSGATNNASAHSLLSHNDEAKDSVFGELLKTLNGIKQEYEEGEGQQQQPRKALKEELTQEEIETKNSGVKHLQSNKKVKTGQLQHAVPTTGELEGANPGVTPESEAPGDIQKPSETEEPASILEGMEEAGVTMIADNSAAGSISGKDVEQPVQSNGSSEQEEIVSNTETNTEGKNVTSKTEDIPSENSSTNKEPVSNTNSASNHFAPVSITKDAGSVIQENSDSPLNNPESDKPAFSSITPKEAENSGAKIDTQTSEEEKIGTVRSLRQSGFVRSELNTEVHSQNTIGNILDEENTSNVNLTPNKVSDSPKAEDTQRADIGTAGKAIKTPEQPDLAFPGKGPKFAQSSAPIPKEDQKAAKDFDLKDAQTLDSRSGEAFVGRRISTLDRERPIVDADSAKIPEQKSALLNENEGSVPHDSKKDVSMADTGSADGRMQEGSQVILNSTAAAEVHGMMKVGVKRGAGKRNAEGSERPVLESDPARKENSSASIERPVVAGAETTSVFQKNEADALSEEKDLMFKKFLTDIETETKEHQTEGTSSDYARLSEISIHNSGLRRSVLPGLVQVVNQAASEEKQVRENWQKHSFELEDGNKVNLSTREVDGVLQVKLAVSNVELARLMHQYEQEIKDHLLKECNINIDLQFEDQNSNGMENFFQQNSGSSNGSNTGMAGTLLEDGDLIQEDITPKTAVRNFGYNRNEWTA
tara:strand:+ start:200281 stop:202422 length:2142 start_codon:yes stop_codon:yes gene_type:complete